ncbi:effector-associated constant component EACC1 [Amycolatopsis sp. H20-H5]|uniref:effector-associated constant component EACC1 n=1 Tax=Amycolatopsis sp. H20-H5 TaxID=3046309 RepID=UPI002DBA7FED|nr:hypothetical protein [Amycolatopsis sp. H20-H5]MEC3974290.1 hypothetical protein [Amycolatopsis sp. H20-H5]
MINEQPRDARAARDAELHVSLHGDDAERQLRGWLVREDELRGCLEWRDMPIRHGHMSGVVDMLVVTLGGAGAVLAQSLSTWLTQRHADITVTVKAPYGREVIVNVRRARDPETVIREVKALIAPVEE